MGPLVRIGPAHLLTDDPELVRRMLAPRTDYTRGPWFDCFTIDPHESNIASERNQGKHNTLRSQVAPGMTGKGIKDWESIVSERISAWTARLAKQWVSPNIGDTKVYDIGRGLQFLGIDIMTQLCFGAPLGFVETDTDLYDYMKMFEERIPFNLYVSTFLELHSLRKWIARFPWLHKKLAPTVDDKQGIGKLMGITKAFVDQRLTLDAPPQNDMLGSFLEHGISGKVAEREFMTFILAGSDTTATAARVTLLAVISNPSIYMKLQHEVRNTLAGGNISSPINNLEAKKLPYLQACIFEGLRLLPPTAQLSERMTPPNGDTIHGYSVPGGVFVALNFKGVQRNPIYGADTDIYRPERWLIHDEKRLHEMRRTLDLVFGHGATKCLGYQLALMILHKIFFELFRKFEMSIANPLQPWVSKCYGLYFQSNLNVCLTLRD